MATKNVIDPIRPDPLTLWLHNKDGFLWGGIMYFSAGLVFAFFGPILISLTLMLLGIFSLSMKPIVCGWVHTYAAYCIDINFADVEVKEE